MQLSSYIDHTLLRADATSAVIDTLCKEAVQYKFYSVCVNSSNVTQCVKALHRSSVKVCSVVGFPLGAMATEGKAFETEMAVAHGASEVDMVMNIGALKDRRIEDVTKDIAAVVSAAQGRVVKVIIETSLLTDEEKTLACKAALEAKAHFVKTSTGFGGGGATVEDVKLMKSIVGSALEVKASGGIKSREQALALIAAGATRLGTSSGISLIQGQEASSSY